MIKYYTKIAEDDYNILRHNLDRNDYNNNVLPRLRYLINNDVHIEENMSNVSNEIQVFWREK